MIQDLPVADYLQIQVYAATRGFILGRSRLSIDTLDSTALYEWVNYTDQARNANIQRGAKKSGIKNEIEVGTFTASFYDAADPNTDPNITPNIPIRVMTYFENPSTEELEGFELFTGKISDCQVTYDLDKSSGELKKYGYVHAVDAVSELGQITRYGAGGLSEPYEKYEERIARLAESVTDIPIVLPEETEPELIWQSSHSRTDYLGYGFSPVPPPDIDFDGWERIGGVDDQLTESGALAGGYNIRYTDDRNLYALEYLTSCKASPPGGWPVNIAADTYGAKRLVTGLIPGKTYTLKAQASFKPYIDEGSVPPSNHVDSYKLGVIGIGWGVPVNIKTATEGEWVDLEYEFTATATSHEIAYILAEDVSRPFAGGGTQTFQMHRELFRDIKLEGAASASDIRLSATVYASSLKNHFSLACDSVGAYWWIDKTGTIRFKKTLGAEAIKASFVDEPGLPQPHYYTDIRLAYDTKNIANDIVLANKEIIEDPENPGNALAKDYEANYKDLTSIKIWANRAASIDTNIYTGTAFEASLDTVAGEFLELHKEPFIHYETLRWNVGSNRAKVAALDIYDRIIVKQGSYAHYARILNLNHEISPTRHMVTLELRYDGEYTL